MRFDKLFEGFPSVEGYKEKYRRERGDTKDRPVPDIKFLFVRVGNPVRKKKHEDKDDTRYKKMKEKTCPEK